MDIKKIDEMINIAVESIANEINDTGTFESEKIIALTGLIKARAELENTITLVQIDTEPLGQRIRENITNRGTD